MFSHRFFISFLLAFFFWGAHVPAQIVYQQPQQTAQQQQQRIQQIPIQQQPIQQQIQTQPVQTPPVQTPPLGMQGGTSVYNPHAQQPAVQPGAMQIQPGFNTGQPNMGQPMRVAQSNPGIPVGQTVPLYDPSGVNRTPLVVQPPSGPGIQQGVPQGMEHVGHAEPANRIIPFWLEPAEQQELDAFLARWERFSASVNRYDVNFNVFFHDPIPGKPQDQPNRVAFGYFKYIANPRRFVLHVEGEWQGKEQIKWDEKKNTHVFAEKIIIDEKSVHVYDYKALTVRQINVPPELIGKGIADSPLPLIFGAKADDLRRRFSMKIERFSMQVENTPVEMIRLFARPRFIEDQQEFKEIEILLFEKTLTARGLRQWDINGMSYKIYDLQHPAINPKDIFSPLEIVKKWFTPEIPRDWKREEINWVAPLSSVPPPGVVPSMPQPQIANPPNNAVPPYRLQ